MIPRKLSLGTMHRTAPRVSSRGAAITVMVAATALAAIGTFAPAAALPPEEIAIERALPDSSSLDVRAFRILNGAAEHPFLNTLMPIATDLEKWRIAVILVWCALVIFGKTRGRWAAFMLIPIIAASDQLSSSLMKPIFERSRPCEILGSVHLWLEGGGWITTPAEVFRSYKDSFSFPSSHAANITASMLFLGLVYRRWLAPFLAVALLVSYSRIYTGVHWPSDVLGGMLIGAVIAALAYAVFRHVLPSPVRGSALESSKPVEDKGRNGPDAAAGPTSPEIPPAR